MIRLTKEELSRWRAEVDLGVEFRDKEFGTYRQSAPGSAPQTTLAGTHLDRFEQGAREDAETVCPPLNLVYPIVKTIVPTLFFQHPRVVAQPDSRTNPEAADDAFYVAELLNRDLRDSDFRFVETSQQTVFDSFVLGFGVVKVGYATEFGADILPTKQETRQRFRDRVKEQVTQTLIAVGIKASPKEEEPEPEFVHPEATIRSERPYLQWISPFDFVIDPRARSLEDARWVAQCIRRTVAEVKRDRTYSKEKHDLVPDPIEHEGLPDTFIEEFQTVDIWEVHYKDHQSPTGIRLLKFATTQTRTTALYHDDNVADIGGWQFDWLTFNKHGHRLYPISTLGVAAPLLDRINSAFDAVLEQVDKFQQKLVSNERVDAANDLVLQSSVLGAHVKVTGNEDVRGAVASINAEQLNAEIIRFLEYVVDFVILITGLTRAQLTGLSTAQTATEAQIGQAGTNVRRTDEGNQVNRFLNRVVTKLWRIKAQFQDLTAIDLPMEQAAIQPTGISQTQWYPPIDETRAARLKVARFKVMVEVGSAQKPNLEVIRAQFEQFARALMEPAVTQGLALEGKRLFVSEILRQWAGFFVEHGLTGGFSRMVVPITDPALQQSLLNYGQKPEAVAATNGTGRLAGSVPNMADFVSSEKGQGGVPLA